MRQNLAGDLTAGIGAGLAYVPLIVAIAFIAYGPLGAGTAAAMSVVVYASTLFAGVLVALLARCPILVAGPSGASALVMAGLFSGLMANGPPPDIAHTMAITLAVCAVAGVVQLALMFAGAAALGPLAPYPVVSGLVSGTAVLILLSQLGALRAHPAETLVALVTAATMLRFPPRWKIPPVLPAILVGVIAYHVLTALRIDAGPSLPAMPSPLVWPGMALQALAAAGSQPFALPWPAIVTAGVTIALLGVLDTLTAVSALSDLGVPVDGRRELRASAMGNLLVAVTAGGPPVSTPVAGAMGLYRLGGRTVLAPIVRLATVGICGAFFGGLLPLVPQGALVGLVLAIGWLLLDREPVRLLLRAARDRGPHRYDIAGSAVISLIVVAVAVIAGLAVAVAVGAAACLLLFTAAMAGTAVRRVRDGAGALSRVRRSADENTVLLGERHAVAVLELAGPLFFGNVSPLAKSLEDVRRAGARYVVVDLSRIVRVDLSGARRLMSIVRQGRDSGLEVVLAPVHPGHPVADYLAALGSEPGASFATLPDALAAAEERILGEAGTKPPAFETAEETFAGLGVAPDHASELARRVEVRDCAAGEMLCRAGDPASDLFVLMRGAAAVVLPDGTGSNRTVLARLSAGSVIGERALFEAGRRTADVLCAEASRVMILSGSEIAALIRQASPAALALVLAISRNTSTSLQMTNAALQNMEG